MNVARWVVADWPVSIRTLGTRLKNFPFTPTSLDGFSVDRVRDDFLDATYIEKIVTQDTINDPFGNEQIIERISYKRSTFSLYAESPNIEIKSISRSNRSLINKLLEICNFQLSLLSPDVDPIKWIECLCPFLDSPALINSLQISALDVKPGVTAKVILKGAEDVRAALKSIAKDKSYYLDKAQAIVVFETQKATIQLSKNGLAKFSGDHVGALRLALRVALKEAINRI